jgi:hypothetical protein
MKGKRTLVIGGLVAALAVPAGVAFAATSTPSPSPGAGAGTNAPGYGPGGGHGRMMGGGYGDPDDCPFYNSTEAQQWRAQRDQRQQLTPAERQKLVQQHREQMQKLMSGAATS